MQYDHTQHVRQAEVSALLQGSRYAQVVLLPGAMSPDYYIVDRVAHVIRVHRNRVLFKAGPALVMPLWVQHGTEPLQVYQRDDLYPLLNERPPVRLLWRARLAFLCSSGLEIWPGENRKLLAEAAVYDLVRWIITREGCGHEYREGYSHAMYAAPADLAGARWFTDNDENGKIGFVNAVVAAASK